MNNALIFAGGSGIRMNTKSKPKQFLQLYGKEIIVHTLENFDDHAEIDGIVVMMKEDWIDFFETLKTRHRLDRVKWVVAGGETSQESISRALYDARENRQIFGF